MGPAVDPSQISTREFQDYLKELARTTGDPIGGFFGPGSMTWKVSSEGILFMTGMRTLLLQLAHPKVAQGVADHSNFRSDPYGRAYRTFDAVFKIVFGSHRTAIKAACRVHAVHSKVRGELADPVPGVADPAYIANDPQLLLWVHATLVESALFGYELVFGRLSPGERDLYYEESKLFGYMFGIADAVLPPDLPAFQRYFDTMCDGPGLTVTPTAREVADALLNGSPLLFKAGEPINRVLAAGMLHPRLREGFGLTLGPMDRLIYRSMLGAARAAGRATPGLLRRHPAAHAARARSRRSGLTAGAVAG